MLLPQTEDGSFVSQHFINNGVTGAVEKVEIH